MGYITAIKLFFALKGDKKIFALLGLKKRVVDSEDAIQLMLEDIVDIQLRLRNLEKRRIMRRKK